MYISTNNSQIENNSFGFIVRLMEKLSIEYGHVEWKRRYDPAFELVYTILSQHTSDTNSERAFHNLICTFESLEAIADAPVNEIEQAIRTGGLSKRKAPTIKFILRKILDDLGSFDLSFLSEMSLNEAKEWLKKLPGVGPKTAAIILCFSMGMPAMPVDTHIYRVSKRLGLIDSYVTPEEAHDILESMISAEDVFAFHMYLIRHGRQICKARLPQCNRCVISMECPSRLDLSD